jgi:LmbE family N-acetylglucosaminyl deacetylase
MTRLLLGLVLAACACTRAPAPLDVAPATRLVVVAPHPDDETLAAGGLIQRVLRSGGTVRVVVLTAGDGYLEAAAALSGTPAPSVPDYRKLGQVRDAEVRAAMRTVGVTDLVLLDGPDGGLDALWTTRTHGTPYVSPTSGRGPFFGVTLLAGLREVIAAVRPTLVVVPDPRDHHADHAAAGRFALAALDRPADERRVLTYIVHDTVWPPEHPPDDVLPRPSAREYGSTPWVSFTLTPEEMEAKRTALAAYRSQWPVNGGLLERFVRRNEVFAVAGGGPG